MPKKVSYEAVKASFEKEGYTLLTKTYKNNKQKLEYICSSSERHKHSVTWAGWCPPKKARCPYCAGNAKLTIEFIREEFAKEGYELLTKTYDNNKQKLEYICKRGHKHRVNWADWGSSKKVRCPYCNGRPIITLEIVRQAMAKEDYILLTTVYKNNKQRLDYICPRGHRHHTTWACWNSHNYRCPYCYGNAKKTIEEVRKSFEAVGYILVTKIYVNGRTKLHSICPNGHDYFVTLENWVHNTSRCPKCNVHGVSRQEISLFDFVKNIYPGTVIGNGYSLISPKELDIIIPDKKIAIEYCGLYWHSERMGKDKHYHLDKLNKCQSKGYELITIFSDELINNKEIVWSKIKNLLGCNKTQLIESKACVISEITSRIAKKFCIQNNIQTYVKSSINLGVFYKDKIISVMTFKEAKPFVWQLTNFCSKIDYNVVDALSTLLKYFEDNFQCEKVFVDQDRRWPTVINYNELGFKCIEETEPRCWYIKVDERMVTNDKDEFNLNRIWDCGYLRYTKITGKEIKEK